MKAKAQIKPAKGQQAQPPTPGAVRTIHFEDSGQDFLEWDLDSQDIVIGCRPAQAWLWIGTKVLAANIYDRPKIITSRNDGKATFLKHTVTLIEVHGGAAA